MKCINTSHPSFVKLLQESNIPIFELEIAISDWQEQNNTDDFPTLEQLQPIKKGVSELFKENVELASIGTPKQYSQYLDTIFPNSKVKDIVYHGSPIKGLQELKRGENNQGKFYTSKYGITFTDRDLNAMYYAGQISDNPEVEDDLTKGEIYSVLLNIKNPETKDFNNDSYGGKFGSSMGDYNISLEKAYKEGKDGFIATRIADPFQDQTNIVVFEPEQIHILGSKQDIEGFKQFVNNNEDKQLSDFLKQNLGMSNWDELLSSEQDKDNVKNKERYEQLEAIINRPNSREEERVRELGENIQLLSTSDTLLSSLGIETTEKLPVSTISTSSFSDSASFRNILGRNYEEIQQEFGPDSMEGRTWTLSSIIQSLNTNPINSRLARKLGTDKIRLVDDSEFAIFVDGKTNELTTNINLLSKRLKNIKHVSKLIDALVFEELIHQTVNKVATEKEIEAALKELTPTDIEQAKKYYGSSKITNYQALQELVRQDVQNRILGYTTEEVVDHPNINSILTKVWEYLKSIFIKPSVKNISDKTEYFINDTTVNYYDEPTFKKNNPNYNPNKIIASQIGINRQELTPELTPYLSPEEPNNNVQQKTYDIILDFMKKAGISQTDIYEYAEQHGIDISDINGLASPIEGIVAVIDGTELQSLPEEVMHIAVAIIKSVNPTLFKELIKDITSYQIYKDIYPDYSERYRNKDGSVNILKVKEEAVAKLLVQILDNQVEPKKIQQSKTLLQKIKDFFRLLFKQNSFTRAIRMIQEERLNVSQIDEKLVDGVFYQTREESISKIEEKEQLIKLDPSTTKKDEKGNPKMVYWYGLKELYARISDKSKEMYDKWAKDNNITKTEYEQALADLKAEKGTSAHADLEYLGSIMTNNEGLLLDKPLDDSSYNPKTNPVVYNKLKQYLFAKLKSFPEGTKFKFEKKVVNENAEFKAGTGIGGTIDVLAFLPDNTVQILDWKFMDINTDKYDDLPYYKTKAFEQQMQGYKNILSKAYGIPESSIKATIIPFKTKYHYKKDTSKLPTFVDIEVGNVDPKQEEKDYLLPYNVSSDKTGIEHLDQVIDKLNSIKDSLEKVNTQKNAKKKVMKTALLNDITKAIRHISSKHSLIPFTKQAVQFINNANKLIGQIDSITDKTPLSELSEYAIEVMHTIDNIDKYTDLFELSQAEPELKKVIEDISKEAIIARKKLTKEVFEPFMQKIANRRNIHDALKNEVKIGQFQKWFTATGRVDTAAVRAFFVYLQDSNNQRDYVIKKKLNQYTKILESAGKDAFKNISKNNELIYKYSKQFYEDLDKAVAAKNYKWIIENVDVEKYKQKIAEELEYQLEVIQTKPLSEEEMNEEISKMKEKYSLKPEGKGWFILKDLKKFPTDKWFSEDYKGLSQPLLNLYNFVSEINTLAYENGYLSFKDKPSTFLPKVEKTVEEKIAKRDFRGVMESLFRGMTINEEDFQYGTIDPDTNQIMNKIPTPFKNLEEGQEQSEQYEQNFMKFTKSVYNYIYKSEIEGITKALVKLESQKQAINTNFLGKIVKKDLDAPVSETNVQLASNNEANLDFLNDKLAQSFYGQKYVNSKNEDIVLANAGKVFTFLNKKLKKNFGVEPFPKNLNGKQYSLMKTMDTFNKFFQLKTLGLNPYTGISQLFGGAFQAYINSGQLFTNKDWSIINWQNIQGYLTGNREESKKLIAALKYFDPYIKNEKVNDQIKALNKYKINTDNVQDLIGIFMKAPDMIIQTSIFTALWKNMIVIDGKVENVREYVRTLPEFQTVESAINVELFEQKVEELKDKYSISKHSKVVDNELVIDGVEENSENVFAQRNLAKALTTRAMGSLPEEQTRGMNATIWGNSMMIFKNWIPSSVALRFAKLQYSQDLDAWEHGRFLTMVQFNGARLHEYFYFFLDSMISFFGLNPAISQGGKLIKGDNSSVERIKQSYEKAKKDYIERTGKSEESFISEAQFAQLMQKNMQSMAKEVAILTLTLSAFLTAKAIADDEDRLRRSRMKALIKQLDKISDEVWFYYSPLALSQLTNGNLIPSVNVLTDAMKIVRQQFRELYGIAIDDDKLIEDNKVIKYYLKSFPITNQLAASLPLWAPDTAKDLGIEINSQSRR